METEPARMTAAEASSLIQSKKMSCEELVRSCLARIASRDSVVKAWLRMDPDHVIRRAREADKLPPKTALSDPVYASTDAALMVPLSMFPPFSVRRPTSFV